MKTIPMIAVLVAVCVVLTLVMMTAPVLHGAALSYLTLTLSVSVCLLCIVGLVSYFFRK